MSTRRAQLDHIPSDRRGTSAAESTAWAARLGQLFVGLAMFVEFGAVPISPRIGYAMVVLGALVVCGSPVATIRSIRLPAAVVALLAWMVVSVTWSDQLTGSLNVVLVHDLLPLVVLVPVLGVLTTRQTTAAMVWAIRLAVAITAVALIVMPSTRLQATNDPYLEPLLGWRGLFGHKNGLSVFLPFAVATILSFDRSRWGRWTTLGALAALTLGSASVSGLLACGLVALGYVWLRSYRMRRPAFLVSAASVGVAAVATLSLWLLFVPSETIAKAKIAGKDVTFTGRTEIWRSTWSAITERPLQGFGLGGIMNTDTPSARTAQIWAEVNWQVPHAHNSILDFWVQVGLVGLLLYLAVFVPTIVRAIRNLWIRTEISEWTILWAVSLAVLSFSETAFMRGGLYALLIAHCFLTRPDDPTPAPRR